jgi:hypothetical protein
MLADRETETGAPREADVVGSFDTQSVQYGHGVGDPRGQGVGGNLVRLVAAALAAVVGKDEAEVLFERLSERRGLRELEGIREALVQENRPSAAPRVFEEGSDVIVRIRRIGHARGPSSV